MLPCDGCTVPFPGLAGQLNWVLELGLHWLQGKVRTCLFPPFLLTAIPSSGSKLLARAGGARL